jgi:hypothetical protein
MFFFSSLLPLFILLQRDCHKFTKYSNNPFSLCLSHSFYTRIYSAMNTEIFLAFSFNHHFVDLWGYHG